MVHRVGDAAFAEVSASTTGNVHVRVDVTIRSERPVEVHARRMTITVGETPVAYTITGPSSLRADSTIAVSSTKSQMLSYWVDVDEPYERENGSTARGLRPGTSIVVSGTYYIQRDTTFFDLPAATFIHRDVCADKTRLCFF